MKPRKRTTTSALGRLDRVDDAAIVDGLRRVRQALDATGSNLGSALLPLESVVAARLEHLRKLAEAVAEANVRGVADERRATIDALTGVSNRGTFDEGLKRAVRRVRRSGEPLSLLFIDADHFKQINDRHGHVTGDAVLRSLARAIVSAIRPSGVAVRGRRAPIAARYGGEEFVVLLERTPSAEVLRVAERIRSRAEHAHHRKSTAMSVRVTVSIGVATLGPEGGVDNLLRRADEALYRAKAAGRNRVSIAIDSPALDAAAIDSAAFLVPLKQAS